MCVTSLQAILHSSTQHLCGFWVRPRSFIGCHQVFFLLRMGSCVLIILTSGMWYCNCRLVLDETDLRIKAQSSLFFSLENCKWSPFKFCEPAVFFQFSYKMQFLNLPISLLKTALIFYMPSAQFHPKNEKVCCPKLGGFVTFVRCCGEKSCDWRKRQPLIGRWLTVRKILSWMCIVP